MRWSPDGTKAAANRGSDPPYGKVVAPLRRRPGLGEVRLAKAIEARTAAEDPAADLRSDAGVPQHPLRHLGKARVEMRKIARHANRVGSAQQLDRGADFSLAALDRRETVALPVFERRQFEIGRVAVVVLPQIPLDPSQESRHPPALCLEERDL